MKINIDKLQSGGHMLFSAVANPYHPLHKSSQSGTSAGSGDKDGASNLLPKATLEKLMQEGLVNEANILYGELAKMEKKLDQGLPIDRNELARLRSMTNSVLQHSDQLKTAQQFADKNMSLDDVAIDQNGYIYAYNQNGKVSKVSFSDFDPENYQALSVGELIEYRRNSPDAVGNSDIIKTIGNSVGIEKINTFIQDILSKVGSTSSHREAMETLKDLMTSAGSPQELKYMSVEEYDAIRRTAAAAKQIGLDTLFATERSTENSNIQIAAKYILSILPKNMRTQLQGTYIAQGGDPSSDYAAELVSLAALSSGNKKDTFKMNYSGGANSGSGTKKDGTKTVHLTGLESLIYGITPATYELTSKKMHNISMVLHGYSAPLTDTDNKPLKEGPLRTEILDKGLGDLIDHRHVYIGQSLIDYGQLDYVFADKDKQALTVWFPTDGKGAINWDLAYKYHTYLNYLKSNPSITEEDRKKKLEELGITGNIDNDGNYVGNDSHMEQFVVIHGYTTEEGVGKKVLVGNPYADEVPTNERSSILEYIRQGYARSNQGRNNEAKSTFEEGWFDRTTDLYEVPIIMRVAKNANSHVSIQTGHGPTFNVDTKEQSAIKQGAIDLRLMSAGVLNNNE